MRLMLTCPNRQWVKGNDVAEKAMGPLRELGFTFEERPVPGGVLLYATGPVWVDVDTVDELSELQRKIGEPLRLEEGVAEIAG